MILISPLHLSELAELHCHKAHITAISHRITIPAKTQPILYLKVEDDVVTCETVVEEKCEDETSGYTTNTKCSKWPREVCNVQKTAVKKFTPETRCQKVPVELCGPAGNFK